MPLRNCIQRWMLVLLILLLGVQLTGLTCVDDWAAVSHAEAALIQHPAMTGHAESLEPGADSCPCHLMFSDPPLVGVLVIHPGSLEPSPIASSVVPVLVSTLLHPPILT